MAIMMSFLLDAGKVMKKTTTSIRDLEMSSLKRKSPLWYPLTPRSLIHLDMREEG